MAVGLYMDVHVPQAIAVVGGRWLVRYRGVAGRIRDGLIAAKGGGSNYAGR